MPPLDSIADYHADMADWRRDIHAHPELGFEEQRTSDLVAAKLEEFGIEVTRGIGKTGLVGRLRAGNSPRTIGLRADMDCLDSSLNEWHLVYYNLYCHSAAQCELATVTH